MLDPRVCRNLLFASGDVLRKLRTFDVPLVLGDVEQYGGSTPKLRGAGPAL